MLLIKTRKVNGGSNKSRKASSEEALRVLIHLSKGDRGVIFGSTHAGRLIFPDLYDDEPYGADVCGSFCCLPFPYVCLPIHAFRSS